MKVTWMDKYLSLLIGVFYIFLAIWLTFSPDHWPLGLVILFWVLAVIMVPVSIHQCLTERARERYNRARGWFL